VQASTSKGNIDRRSAKSGLGETFLARIINAVTGRLPSSKRSAEPANNLPNAGPLTVREATLMGLVHALHEEVCNGSIPSGEASSYLLKLNNLRREAGRELGSDRLKRVLSQLTRIESCLNATLKRDPSELARLIHRELADIESKTRNPNLRKIFNVEDAQDRLAEIVQDLRFLKDRNRDPNFALGYEELSGRLWSLSEELKQLRIYQTKVRTNQQRLPGIQSHCASQRGPSAGRSSTQSRGGFILRFRR
jgi:hypothetical protein